MSALTPVPTYTFQQCVNPDAMHTGQQRDKPLLHTPTGSVNNNAHTCSGPAKQNMSNTHNICTHLQADLRGNRDNGNDYDNL